jgi:hypothetical protein
VGDLLGPFRWFDALYINQKDNEEKSKQVQLMGAIYSKASQVIIWLSKEVFHLKNLNLYVGKFLKLDKALVDLATVTSLTQELRDGSVAAAAKSIPRHSWDLLRLTRKSGY